MTLKTPVWSCELLNVDYNKNPIPKIKQKYNDPK